MATFIVVTPISTAWGEGQTGVRAAVDLVGRGHRVLFAAPPALEPIVASTGVEWVALSASKQNLARVVERLVARSKSSAVVLADLALCSMRFAREHTDPAFV